MSKIDSVKTGSGFYIQYKNKEGILCYGECLNKEQIGFKGNESNIFSFS